MKGSFHGFFRGERSKIISVIVGGGSADQTKGKAGAGIGGVQNCNAVGNHGGCDSTRPVAFSNAVPIDRDGCFLYGIEGWASISIRGASISASPIPDILVVLPDLTGSRNGRGAAGDSR